MVATPEGKLDGANTTSSVDDSVSSDVAEQVPEEGTVKTAETGETSWGYKIGANFVLCICADFEVGDTKPQLWDEYFLFIVMILILLLLLKSRHL